MPVQMMDQRSDQVHLHPADAERLDRIGKLLEPIHELAKMFLEKHKAEEAQADESVAEPKEPTVPPPNTMITGG